MSKIVKGPIANASVTIDKDADSLGLTMTETLTMAREKAENAWIESTERKTAQKGMIKVYIKEVDKMSGERFEVAVTCNVSQLESEKTLEREPSSVLSRITLETSKTDSANALFYEMWSAFHRK